MKKKQLKYFVANERRYVATFKQFVKIARAAPHSRISIFGSSWLCAFSEGIVYDNRVFTNKQRKFLKANFEVKPRAPKKSLSKFQRRQVKRKFVTLWSSWPQDRRTKYIQTKARQLQRESSAFPGCPTFQECINVMLSDLISLGCKDVYI